MQAPTNLKMQKSVQFWSEKVYLWLTPLHTPVGRPTIAVTDSAPSNWQPLQF